MGKLTSHIIVGFIIDAKICSVLARHPTVLASGRALVFKQGKQSVVTMNSLRPAASVCMNVYQWYIPAVRSTSGCHNPWPTHLLICWSRNCDVLRSRSQGLVTFFDLGGKGLWRGPWIEDKGVVMFSYLGVRKLWRSRGQGIVTWAVSHWIENEGLVTFSDQGVKELWRGPWVIETRTKELWRSLI